MAKPPVVIDKDKDREFRKANSAVGVRVISGGTLTLTGRKLFNILLYYTQRLGQPGQNAPEPWEKCPRPDTYYWLPLRDVCKDVEWGSKDWTIIIETLTQLQRTLVVSDEPTGGFASDQLIGSIRIREGAGRRPAMLGWQLPPGTQDLLRAPQYYTRLSVYYLTSLQTAGGAALYEIGKRYLTNHEGKTAKRHWHWWYEALTGSPVGGGEYPEYRYFKRDVLKRAIADVNVTDIRIELIEYKKGRSMDELQFTVSPAPQGNLDFPPGPIIDGALLDRIEALGIGKREAEDMVATHAEGFLRATIALVEERMANPKLDSVKSPAALLRTAIRDRYVENQPKLKAPARAALPVDKPAKVEPADPVRTARCAELLAEFDALEPAEQKKQIQAFAASGATFFTLAKKPASKGFRQVFANWLLDKGTEAPQP